MSQPLHIACRSIRARWLILMTLLLTLSGCASLQPGFEKPTVTVNRFQLAPDSGLLPRFEISLQVVNPNRTPLALAGVAYTVTLEGHRILTGVSNQLPVIEGYGQAEIQLLATTSLLDSLRLFSDLTQRHRDRLHYELSLKLDPGGLQPPLRVTDSGQISLSPAGR